MGIVFIVIVIAVIVLIDHIRYWMQTNYFLELSNSFACMYNTVLRSLKEDRDVTYESSYFKIEITGQDYDKFWRYIVESIKEVLEAYDMIDPRYLEQMDEDMYNDIYQLYHIISDINVMARNEAWKRGIDVHEPKEK